jgi:hypothetical protein
MKKIKSLFKNIAILAILLVAFVGCERDFTTLGTGIAGSSNFAADKFEYPVITYNQPTGPVKSNDLSSYLIGYYNDPIYGGTRANIVAQVDATLNNPTFGDNIIVDSVMLTVPYYSVQTGVDEEGNPEYRLDSIYGDTPFKLSIYQNNYFLRDFDPDSDLGDPQLYYSNGSTDDMNLINTSDLEGVLLYSNDEFIPSNEEIIIAEQISSDEPDASPEETTIAPSLRVPLNDENDALYWNNLIFAKEGETELSNRNNFLNYFRGFYFKAEGVNGDGNMSLLNITSSNSSVVIYYKNGFDVNDDDNDDIPNYADVDIDGDGTPDNGSDSDADGISDTFDVDNTEGIDENDDGIDDNIEPDQKTFDLNFTGNIVNIIDHESQIIPNGDPVNGDEKLYIKGTQGSVAIINLFEGDENGESDWLSHFKEQNWLINEANLVFYVDQSMVQNHDEPNRLYLYDIENNTALLDFFVDQTGIDTGTDIKVNHAVPLVREDEEDPTSQGVKYKFRITEHINNILLRDSTNVKLGLTVGSNLIALDNLPLLNQNSAATQIVTSSFLTPRSTVLHGNNSANSEKRVWLEIYYTEPDQQ